ncbi:MAG: hypothetical protein LBU34_01580 [Planctomycetaceae bacterium]|jgi:hypothetical protein|nr:hypothetical protein [Planctomycetaceae bacterium]
MEESRFDSYPENPSDEKENENEFSFIIGNLPAREKHALETLKITSIDAFCKYDFSELFTIRGFGETTITRLQLLQEQICEKEQPDEQNKYAPLTLQSPIQNIKFSKKERSVLVLLNVTTVDDFLNLDLSEMILPKGFGEKTRHFLIQNQKQIVQKLLIDIPPLSLEECPVLMILLNPREKKVLTKYRISNWREFACFDFNQIDNTPNLGFVTLRSLLFKQVEVRTKIIRSKIGSLSDFSYDDEFSIFLLDLTPNAKEALWHLGISKISELTKANLNILKLVSTSIMEAYEELYQIQQEFSQIIKKTENPLNDFLTSTPPASFGISDIAAEFLQQNAINSLRDFLFFSIPETYPDLRQLQIEWQSRHTPVEFLRTIPSYFNILLHCQKNQTQNTAIKYYLNDFETAKDFFSVSFEDIVKLTQGDWEAARTIQSLQYELLKSCLDLHKYFDFFVDDEREQGWKQEINKEALFVLPFFGGRHNRNFSAEMFHETFLPNLSLDSIVQGRMLQITKQMGILTLGELLLTTCSHFFLLKHCSKTKITEIQERIRKILFSAINNSALLIELNQTNADHSGFPFQLSPLDKSTPKTLLISLLKRYVFSDRAVDIIAQRVQGRTLEQVAKIYGLTRERIRQIEIKNKTPSDHVYAQSIFAEVYRMLEKSIVTLGGFAPIHEIATQFAADNGWSDQDCNRVFIKFLLDRATNNIVNHIINHGRGYYSTKSYPCQRCERLVAKISYFAQEAAQERSTVTRDSLLVTLLKTCCSECADQPQRISEFFLTWKCISDSLYPKIFGDAEIYRSTNRSMQKMVSNVLKRAPHPLCAREILTLICQRTENDSFTEKQVNAAATFLCLIDKNIFLWERGGVYAYRKHIPIDHPLLIAIEQRVKQLIKRSKAPYVSLYTLFNEYQSECEAEGIPSVHALHSCLKARDMLGVAFMRSPCISVTKVKHKRKNVEVMENWVAQKRDVVSYESLEDFARESGLDSQQYHCTYAKAKSLIKYDSERAVHLNSLHWNQTKQNSILELAVEYWNYCISQGLLYARADQFLAKYKNRLPKLAHGIRWTSDLLFALLLRSESVITFGNTQLVYGFKNNISAPQTFGDIIVEILKRKFKGEADLIEMSSYLRDDLQLVKARLTVSMLQNHPGLVITEDKIYLSKRKNVS